MPQENSFGVLIQILKRPKLKNKEREKKRKKEIRSIRTGKKEIKLLLFADRTSIYTENKKKYLSTNY